MHASDYNTVMCSLLFNYKTFIVYLLYLFYLKKENEEIFIIDILIINIMEIFLKNLDIVFVQYTKEKIYENIQSFLLHNQIWYGRLYNTNFAMHLPAENTTLLKILIYITKTKTKLLIKLSE